MPMKVAVVGATGLVGRVMLEVLREHQIPVRPLIPVASHASVGKMISLAGKDFPVVGMEEAIRLKPHIVLMSAGSGVSREWAPAFADNGAYVIDNSSAWRMEPNVPLVVPEINGDILGPGSRIIANPNCSTIQMVMALGPLHDNWGIRRIVVSTYQSITGTGKAAVEQYEAERMGMDAVRVYPHPIFANCLPHCDVFLENDYTREEMKLVNETRKILNSPDLPVTATAVRVPVLGGHSESVNVELAEPFTMDQIRNVLKNSPGIRVVDTPSAN